MRSNAALSIISLLFLLFSTEVSAQVITIAAARAQASGSTVTVRGMVTNGPELGVIRYIQDATAGIAVYDTDLSAVQRGDSIQVTGSLTDFNGLLEIINVTPANLTIISSGNPIPAPKTMSLFQGFNESYEGQLMRFNNISFSSGGNFAGNTNYNITDGTYTRQVRISNTNNIPGTPIPAGNLSIIGLMGEFNGTYQLFPRDLNDFDFGGSAPVFLTKLIQSNISTTGFSVSFQTINEGNTILRYGTTANMPLFVSNPAQTTSHQVNLAGLTPGAIYYVQALSVSATNDTSISAVQRMATESNSTGAIRAYFNHPVDLSVAQTTQAQYLAGKFADTIKAYIEKATQTLDVAIYNMDNNNGLVDALNAAYQRGVAVRVISDDGVNATAWGALNVGSGNKKKSPTGTVPGTNTFFGLMHNKFMVVDANSTDPEKPWILTGSTNWTNGQLNTDANNMVFIQDQSLARAFTIEFEEMWSNKFGPQKTDNTPHEFLVGGKRVELYFSPSDNPEEELIRTISEADVDLYFAVYVYTRNTISFAIRDVVQQRSVAAAGMMNDTSSTGAGSAFSIAHAASSNIILHTEPYILHHKYLIVDPHREELDPVVLTGSHNFTNSARTRNDENFVIIHDGNLANQFFQEWKQRFIDSGGDPSVNAPERPIQIPFHFYPNPASDFLVAELPESAGAQLFIRDLNGRLLAEQIIEKGVSRLQLPIGHLSAGMYLVQIRTESRQGVFRLVKE